MSHRFTIVESPNPIVHTTDHFGRCLITGDKVVWATVNGDDGEPTFAEGWIVGFKTARASRGSTDTFVIADLTTDPAVKAAHVTLDAYSLIYIETPPATD